MAKQPTSVKIDLSEIQKFQVAVSRYGTHKQDNLKHDPVKDLELIEAYKKGNEDAGWELFKSYKDVLAIILKNPTKAPRNTDEQKKKLSIGRLESYEREDLFQEMAYQFFLLVLEFVPEKPFEHAVRSMLHQRVFNRFFSVELTNKLVEVKSDNDEDFEMGELVKESSAITDSNMALYRALNELTGLQREVLEYTIVKGWTAKATAEELDTSKRAVEEAKRRGLVKLKKIMIEGAEQDGKRLS